MVDKKKKPSKGKAKARKTRGAGAKPRGGPSRAIPLVPGRRLLPPPPPAAPMEEDYLPLPEGSPPTLSLLRRMEGDFERALDNPRVSVVIVNHEGVDLLWHCLFALKTQTYQPHEIILVDNASEDASLVFVRSNYPQVKVLECQENFGFAMGCNLGAKTAEGDLVAFLNNDAVTTPDWLARMVAVLQEHWPKTGLVSADVRSNRGVEEKGAGEDQVLNFLGSPVEGYYEDPQVLFHPEGCAFLAPRFLVADGPFDPDYFLYQEDAHLGWKFRLQGRGTRRAPGARVFHEPGGTMSRFQDWRRVYLQQRNRWLNLLLFYGAWDLVKVLPWMAADVLVRLAQGVASGLNGFLGTLLAFLWLLFHPVPILRKRAALQEKRRVKDKDILPWFSGRVARDGGWFSRLINFISLTYCLVVGLEVLEFREDR